MAVHNELGKWGEKVAVDYLIAKGYAIAETNWKMNRLEVDIVAYKGDRIVFVEVKTRSTRAVDARLAIDRKRIGHLMRAANAYVQAYNVPHEIQFDVILIIGTQAAFTNPEIEHIPDAFLPPLRTTRR